MLRLRLLLTLIIAGVLTLPLQAATITVDDDGKADYSSIQAAINAANNGDKIIVSPGTYVESIDFLGKAITLRSASGDPADTIIDGGGSGRVVICKSGETSTTVLDGFTITNGSADYGGGMYNYNSSSPTVTHCTFSGNTANEDGGGMFNNDNSSPTVTNCTFSGNTANSHGGGMFNNSSSPRVTNCAFSGNTADGGGGMYNIESSPTVTNCTFSGNTAYFGGGMFNAFSSPTVTNCILWGDSPDEIDNSSSSTPTVSFSDVQGGLPINTVDGGGNIEADPLFVDFDGPDNTPGTEDDNLRLLWVSPCTDAGDNEAVPGGISFDLDSNPRFVDSSVSPDTGNGTAPLVDMGPYENMSSCLGDETSGDSDGDGFCDNIDACPGFDDNLDDDTDGVPDGCDKCDGSSDTLDADGDNIPEGCDVCPGFDDNLDKDIDTIPDDCDVCVGFDDNVDTDTDSVPDGCDLCPGFYDAIDLDTDGVPYGCDRCQGFDDNVDTDTDGVPDGCDLCSGFDDDLDRNNNGVPDGCEPPVNNLTQNTFHTTIQGAIDASFDGDEMVVRPGSYLEAIDFIGRGITLRSVDPTDPNVVASTIIDGTGHFHVVQCVSGESPNTALIGFTITGGNANGSGSNNLGGGAYIVNSSPTIEHCIFVKNTASSGGGMYNRSNSSPTVRNCTFSGNTAKQFGGGMYNRSNSRPTVTNCTFSGNMSDDNGGGMFNNYSNPTVTNCTFSGNTAKDYGGGMYNHHSSPTVTNCILWGDSPDEILNKSNSSTPNVSYSDLQGGLAAGTIDGGGNINADPLFVDTDGPDNIVGTEDDNLHLSDDSPRTGTRSFPRPLLSEEDNLRLSDGSPCIDAGDTSAPSVITVATDLDGNLRGVDDPATPNTGVTAFGIGIPVDMGAYEFQAPLCSNLPGDINCDGIVNLLDLALLALHWMETN